MEGEEPKRGNGVLIQNVMLNPISIYTADTAGDIFGAIAYKGTGLLKIVI